MRTATGRSLRAGWATLALLAGAEFIIAVDVNVVFVALPSIGSALGYSGFTLQWVVTAYAVTFGGFLLLAGRCADHFGRRSVFRVGAAVVGIGSLIGSVAVAPTQLVAGRAVQGLGAALLFPSTLSLVTTTFSAPKVRVRALAIWGAAGSVGLALGPVLGGGLTELFGWRSVFFVNVVATLILLSGSVILDRDDRPTSRAARFDITGAVVATLATVSLIVALTRAAESGFRDAAVLGTALLAVALIITLVVIERRGRDPLIVASLIRPSGAGLAVFVAFLFGVTDGTVPYYITLFLQEVLMFSPLGAGAVLLLSACAIVVGTLSGGRVVPVAGYRVTLTGAAVIALVGTSVVVLSVRDTDAGLWVLVAGLLLWGLGQGVLWTAMFSLATEGVDASRQGVASGMASTGLQVGLAVGLAVAVVVAGQDLAVVGQDEVVRNAMSRAITVSLICLFVLATLAAVRAPRKGAISTDQ